MHRLNLTVSLDQGLEVAAARHIWAETRTELRPILAALAAELVSLAESASAGAQKVLVVSEPEARAVLAKLAAAPLVE